MTMRPRALLLCIATQSLAGTNGCGSGTKTEAPASERLLVAREGSLVSFDVETGEERPGSVQKVESPVDMFVLEDGTALVNLTTRNEILAVDTETMLERARISASGAKGARPVHAYISPTRDGKTYWLTLNDGEEGKPETNSAAFVDVTPDSPMYLKRVGETSLGVGHHKASFSTSKPRVVISNIADCDNVLTVYDYSDIANIKALATFTGKDAGFTSEAPSEGFNPTYCDPTYQHGLPPAPHGCTTSSVSNKAYCSVTSSGDTIAIDIDANPPTFKRIATHGTGGGFTLPHPSGRYLFVMQESPREGSEDGKGATCQAGQIAVIDAKTDTLVMEVPALYEGAGCKKALKGTPAETANPGHAYFTPDGATLFVPTSGGFEVEDARVDQLMVFDTTSPEKPKQLASIRVGTHTDHSSAALSADGKSLFVVGTISKTVTKVDTVTRKVVQTYDVGENAKVVATFGASGASQYTGPIVGP